SLRLFLLPPVLLSFVYFTCLAASGVGFQNFLPAIQHDLFGVAERVSAEALTFFLVAVSIGILAGGMVADRITHHDRIVVGGLAVSIAGVLLIASIPFALAAAIYALFASGTSLNIYSQIGLVMLIGLMAKNGILMVEFADQKREDGAHVREAIAEAAAIRLRPIAMTLISTVLGALPLILASGAGAEARQAIGWVIFGGLGIAALFTLFLVPALYTLIAPFSTPRSADLARYRREMGEAQEEPGPEGIPA
ncbi:MAG: efflux RND transporter permease subunit, partial [Erythrobacter sp.]